MGIGGIAMGTLAAMLKEKGFKVVGSDVNLYPPMSHYLEALQIPVCQGYRAENIQQQAPDCVIIGNVIRRDNPEAQLVLDQNLPYLSMPQALAKFFLSDHESIVVAGTHGKSTTSALLASLLTTGGLDPSAFIGAFVKDWDRSYRLGGGRYMVIEGDEYDTAFFDKGAKFFHYRPAIGILTSMEFDHADIFADFYAVKETFRRFVHLIPEEGYLIINVDDPNCRELIGECSGKIITYGEAADADWRLLEADYRAGEVHFRIQDPAANHYRLVSGLAGRHNLSNTLAVLAAADLAGLSTAQIQQGLLAFRGVRRRQDVVGESRGVLVIDDFAHHPTAVRETIQALRLHYPQRRLLAVFEPRTNSSRRSIFQSAYTTAFAAADCICIKEAPDLQKIPEAERLNTKQLVQDISRRQAEAHYFENTPALLEYLVTHCHSGDLVLCMSNGSFDGLPGKLLQALQELSTGKKPLAAHR